jgi:peroxiredoxin
MIVQGEHVARWVMAKIGAFTEGMGMTVDMSAIGFGRRSRRYAAVVNNGTVEHMFVEPESSATDPDPYGVSSPENVLKHL